VFSPGILLGWVSLRQHELENSSVVMSTMPVQPVVVVVKSPMSGCPEFAQLPSDVKATFNAEGRRRAQEFLARIRAGGTTNPLPLAGTEAQEHCTLFFSPCSSCSMSTLSSHPHPPQLSQTLWGFAFHSDCSHRWSEG
jgi:hypothetical protein